MLSVKEARVLKQFFQGLYIESAQHYRVHIRYFIEVLLVLLQ